MNLETLKTQITDNDANLGEAIVEITGVKTEEHVIELLEVLSIPNLKIGRLVLEIDPDVSDFFVKKLSSTNIRPHIQFLTLPGIQLRHESWDLLFSMMPSFDSLIELNLKNSNFDYSNDLSYAGNYLATNPQLTHLNIQNDNKSEDKTFKSGDKAVELLNYLKANTYLTSIQYGHTFDNMSNLSDVIQAKLKRNTENISNVKHITQKVKTLKNESYFLDCREQLERTIIDCIKYSITQAKFFGIKLIILNAELCKLESDIILANKDEDFNNSVHAKNLINLGANYLAQHNLLSAFKQISDKETKASSHDKAILHNLREDFLKQWQTIAKIENEKKDLQLAELVTKTIPICKEAMEQVTDKTSGAVLKNLLLVFSGILTLGISFGVYAALTRESRAASGSFFFQNRDLNKKAVEEVKDSLSKLEVKLNPH